MIRDRSEAKNTFHCAKHRWRVPPKIPYVHYFQVNSSTAVRKEARFSDNRPQIVLYGSTYITVSRIPVEKSGNIVGAYGCCPNTEFLDAQKTHRRVDTRNRRKTEPPEAFVFCRFVDGECLIVSPYLIRLITSYSGVANRLKNSLS